MQRDIKMNRFLDMIMEKILSGGWAEEKDAEIIRYGLELNIMKTLISAAMLIAAFALKSAPAVIVFMLIYPPMRSCCGGYHARTRTACFISSMGILAAVIAASKFITGKAAFYASAAMLIAGAAFVAVLAPVEALKKPFDDVERRVFRRRSLLVTAVSSAVCMLLALLKLYSFMLPAATAVFFTGIFLVVGKLSLRKGAVK